MNRLANLLFILLVGQVAVFAGSTNWVTAYYAGWAKWNASPVDIPHIDFSCATHWVLFTLGPTPSGTFDGTSSGIDPTRHGQFVNAVHAAGKKAIIGTGGWGADYKGAVANRAASINFLINLMQTFNYDGIDIDWEPVPSAQYSNFDAWIRGLKAAMKAVKSDAILTAASFSYDQAIVNNQEYFDQINLMTYDMSGPWPKWVSWHNSAIYDAGNRFPLTGGLVPSIDASVNSYTKAGVPASKIGFGIEFYGYIWDNVTGPMQSDFGNVRNTVPYAEIMEKYSALPLKWDVGAQAAYYSASNQFVSFDAETTLTVKARYMKSKGLGGVIVYEVAAAYRPSFPAGYRDRLLQSVRHAFMGGPAPPTDSSPPMIEFASHKDGNTLSGNVTVSVNARDNIGVAGVRFMIDNEDLVSVVTKPPYAININTWKYANGSHSLYATAYDVFGNSTKASLKIAVSNQGAPPVPPDKIVYDDELRFPFTNTSWGANVDPNDASVVKGGFKSVKVGFLAWGAFDILSGTWGTEVPIDPTEYDTLKFDAYPLGPLSVKVAFYNKFSTNIQLKENRWNSMSIPLEFAEPFTRFYLQSNLNKPVTCYIDNIRFAPRGFQGKAKQ